MGSMRGLRIVCVSRRSWVERKVGRVPSGTSSIKLFSLMSNSDKLICYEGVFNDV